MKEYQELNKNEIKRRRRERYIIISLSLVISVLTYTGLRFLGWGIGIPLSSSILVFGLINLNVILLLLLFFFIVRNIVKLLFERKKNIMGSKLRTKLVLAFVILSLFPTIILFFVSVQFISSSIEYWFNLQTERSLETALQAEQDYYHKITDEMLFFGNNLSRTITYKNLMRSSKKKELERLIYEKRKEYNLTSIEIFSQDLETPVCVFKNPRMDLSAFSGPSMHILRAAFNGGRDEQYIESSAYGDLVSGITPVFSERVSKEVVGLIVISRLIPGSFSKRLRSISKGLQEYRQLKMLKKPIKITHIITLSVVTLLIIFSSVWFGFYLSKEMTIPIKELAEGTNRIAAGDYDFFIDLAAKDEIGDLVNSFNKMTADLKISKQKLEQANQELIKNNLEIEQRRAYMEIVLANVTSGVISADVTGKILTINKSAQEMLQIEEKDILQKNYRDVLSENYVKTIDNFMHNNDLFRKGHMERHMNLTVGGKRLSLLTSLNVLRDETGTNLGLVVVFENLTEIEKAQRMAAWREVARRIAHEVKNPLTPIQLSAQRLKKRFGKILSQGEDVKILEECTDMIISQVDELKGLVDEFSSFARMPAVNPAPSDIRKVASEVLSLYREAHYGIDFSFSSEENIPVFDMDREQIRRALINLIDNAIEELDGKGKIGISLSYDRMIRSVRIEIFDNGKGISPEHKTRLFEPYFSTKKQGTGLGLAIVSTIIADHNGFIRVYNNKPHGTRFVIELPVRS